MGARSRRGRRRSTLWIACHLFLRDPITTAAIALGATSRIKIALMAMSPYTVHPVFTAMAAATLDEMYPGRVILSLGAGAPADLKAAGIEAVKPLVTINEALAVSRAMFAGELVNVQGKTFQVQGRRLVNGKRRIPIVLAASRPTCAGKASDGVLVSAATAPAFIRACLDHAGGRGAAGRAFAVRHRLHHRLARATGSSGTRWGSSCVAASCRISACQVHRSDQAALWNAYAGEELGRSRPPRG